MILCFDIGGSWIKAAAAHSVDRIDMLGKHHTPSNDFGAFVDVLRAVLESQSERPDCIAISMTGVVDPDTGIITCANISCIDQLPLSAELEAALDVPVLVANDADCVTVS